MFGCWNIHIAWPGLIAQLDAADRFRAVRGLSSGAGWIWLVPIAGVISVIGVLVAVFFARRQMAERTERTLFETHATHRGLSDAERNCLLQVSEAIGIKQASSIFTLPNAFGRGEEQLLGQVVAGMSEVESNRMRMQLASLREKLGFTGTVGQKADRPSLVDTLTTGSHLKAIHADTGEDLDVIVVSVAAAELTVSPVGAAKMAAGQQWIMRYSYGPTIWEFDATVVTCGQEEMVLHYVGEVRFVNRRRYRRTETALPAKVCSYGFTHDTGDAEPQFTPATVVEVGGPGVMLVETTHSAAVDDKMLIVVKFRSHSVVQSLAKVRWTSRSPSGLTTLGLEMIGLSDRDLNTLTHESTLAQRSMLTDAAGGQFRHSDVAASAEKEQTHDRAR